MDIEYESKISNLIKHINNFEKAKKSKRTSFEDAYGLPMVLFQIINYTIDLADIFISRKKLGFPESYKDSFEILYENKLIKKGLKEELQELCRYRNIIAHEYHKLGKEDITEISTLLDKVNNFIEIIEKNKD